MRSLKGTKGMRSPLRNLPNCETSTSAMSGAPSPATSEYSNLSCIGGGGKILKLTSTSGCADFQTYDWRVLLTKVVRSSANAQNSSTSSRAVGVSGEQALRSPELATTGSALAATILPMNSLRLSPLAPSGLVWVSVIMSPCISSLRAAIEVVRCVSGCVHDV